MDMPDYAEALDDLYESYFQDLNAWEQEFVASVRNRIAGGRELTPSQETKIEEIWDRVT